MKKTIHQLIDHGDGSYSIRVDKGAKGGRYREDPVIGPHAEEIAASMRAAGSGKVWGKVSSHADIHSYRADYATAHGTASEHFEPGQKVTKDPET